METIWMKLYSMGAIPIKIMVFLQRRINLLWSVHKAKCGQLSKYANNWESFFFDWRRTKATQAQHALKETLHLRQQLTEVRQNSCCKKSVLKNTLARNEI